MTDRIETGALQIGDDWTGLFIRGDDALYLSEILSDIHEDKPLDGFQKAWLYMLGLTIRYDVRHSFEERIHVQRIGVK